MTRILKNKVKASHLKKGLDKKALIEGEGDILRGISS
jgi:hypothetical protein